MHPVAQYRQFAIDHRCLAAKLTKQADKQALELLAIGWDRAAEKREAMLRSKERAMAVYEWGVRRRISMLYGELKLLELSLENHGGDKPSAMLELTRLEHSVSHLLVPSSFAHLQYALRQDISLVRERLDQATEQP